MGVIPHDKNQCPEPLCNHQRGQCLAEGAFSLPQSDVQLAQQAGLVMSIGFSVNPGQVIFDRFSADV